MTAQVEMNQVAKADNGFQRFGGRKIVEADRRAMLREFYIGGLPRTMETYKALADSHNVHEGTVQFILYGKNSFLNRRLLVEFLYNVKNVDGRFLASGNPQYSAETVAEIRRLARNGMVAKDIASYTGVSPRTCSRYLNGYEKERTTQPKTVEAMHLANLESGIYDKLEDARQPRGSLPQPEPQPEPQTTEPQEDLPPDTDKGNGVATPDSVAEKTGRDHVVEAFGIILEHFDNESELANKANIAGFLRGQKMAQKAHGDKVEEVRQEGYDAAIKDVAEAFGDTVEVVRGIVDNHKRA